MRKLSEIKNEDALDVLVDLMDPVAEICVDKSFEKAFKKGDKMGSIKLLVKNHKESIIKILAILDGEPVETYEVNVIQIPTKLFELLNDKDMMDFFDSQGLKISGMFFGSATETTEETEE